MTPKPHPRYKVFLDFFTKHQAMPLDRTFFRVAGPRHTTASEILSGEGAYRGGGRWNVPRNMKAIYASDDPVTAMHEATAHLRYYHLPLSNAMPKVTVALQVKAERVIDLTDATSGFPEPMSTLLAEDWRQVMGRGDEPTTQAIGRAAFDAGLQGLLVPSKPSPAGKNLVLFPERFTTRTCVAVLNPELLETLGKSA